VARLLSDGELRTAMGRAARDQASGESWDEVFGHVYDGYLAALPLNPSHALNAIKTIHR
jgi:hypothetical protein